MNFDFSEEQKLLQSESRRFLREHCSPDKARQVMDSDPIQYDAALWQKITQQGWAAITIPEEYGGHGYGHLELCLVAQELGRALAPIPFASTVYLFAELVKASELSHKSDLLRQIAQGELIATLAVSEQLGNSSNQSIAAKFSEGKLTGTKIAVADGMAAQQTLVSALDGSGELVICLVDLNQTEISRSSIESIDQSRPLANITFDNANAVEVPFVTSSEQVLKHAYDCAATLMAFEQVGGSEAALKMGMKYTKERYAFGRQVASFQAIKHKFADMYVANEIALSNAYYAAWALSTGAKELPLAAATARVSASDAYFLASKESLHAHGGMGYTWEFDCHLHYRRAQHLALALGSSHIWKEQISTALLNDEGRAA